MWCKPHVALHCTQILRLADKLSSVGFASHTTTATHENFYARECLDNEPPLFHPRLSLPSSLLLESSTPGSTFASIHASLRGSAVLLLAGSAPSVCIPTPASPIARAANSCRGGAVAAALCASAGALIVNASWTLEHQSTPEACQTLPTAHDWIHILPHKHTSGAAGSLSPRDHHVFLACRASMMTASASPSSATVETRSRRTPAGADAQQTTRQCRRVAPAALRPRNSASFALCMDGHARKLASVCTCVHLAISRFRLQCQNAKKDLPTSQQGNKASIEDCPRKIFFLAHHRPHDALSSQAAVKVLPVDDPGKAFDCQVLKLKRPSRKA